MLEIIYCISPDQNILDAQVHDSRKQLDLNDPGWIMLKPVK
jgi:hypothetical protein